MTILLTLQVAPTSAPVAPTKPSLMENAQLNTVTHSATIRLVRRRPPIVNLFGMLSPTSTATPTYTNQNQTSLYGAGMATNSQPVRATPTSHPFFNRTTSTPAAVAQSSSSNFDDLWSMSLGSSASKPAAGGAGGKSIKDLEKERMEAGIWGSGQKPSGPASGVGGFGFGTSSFGGFSGTRSESASGNDFLL